MNETILNTTDDLYKTFDKFRSASRYKFRGQSNLEWKLVPKAGRFPFKNRNDQELFRQWKRRAKILLDKEYKTDLDYLTIAQHYGIPTRLLDWSHSPLVATFFACIDNYENDGVLYAYKPNKLVLPNEINNPFSTKANEIIFIQPEASSNRILNQLGYFSLHNEPKLELNESNSNPSLERIIIPKSLKKEIIFILNQFGVSDLTIFPDIEGLTKYLCWFYENYEFWDGTIKQ
ncbi:MAG: hypothetical protein A2W90_00865 [Bacteroidetes bacterium GWF2_42_66]|nr:MAG: hypothetical protein A2W92_02150 [Bacteroidetes bacterium GWA2_42_15]OFX99406.1 MAG: hypothetical protein A2W89_12265 [Bacteroidetes bacterium GWE2_42_39]OFY40458.1 MAG: hypothetical protein A2W90_00865 [Bacteroidetes bacterium GWF2_42_66]HBL76920.1 FRG domain-containing protein [Prolixibacteraceae bacterium]HCU62700.1 FRG domain-containing protein [Prolixibacteraceae bacterium]